MTDLKTVLAEIIEKVEALKVSYFHMKSYDSCVLSWIIPKFGTSYDSTILRDVFGIVKSKADGYFASTAGYLYTPEQWAVIRLFTADIGNRVSRTDWLFLAKEQLSKM